MLELSSIPLADLIASLKPLTGVFLVGAVLLILWELAVLLGALITTMHKRESRDGTHGLRA
jgi:hypothetical protein